MSSSALSVEDVIEKFQYDLSTTQEVVENVSKWCLDRRDESETIVKGWMSLFYITDDRHRLSLLFLMNDVCQRERHFHWRYFRKAFSSKVKKIVLISRSKYLMPHLSRIIKIWEEREVFPKNMTAEWRIMSCDDLIAERSVSVASVADRKQEASSSSAAATATGAAGSNDYSATYAKLLKEFKKSSLSKAIRAYAADKQVWANPRNDPKAKIDKDGFLKLMKDYQRGRQTMTEVNQLFNRYFDIVESHQHRVVHLNQLIATLELANIFYMTQKHEAQMVYNAYQSYCDRVKKVAEECRKAYPLGLQGAKSAASCGDQPTTSKVSLDDDPVLAEQIKAALNALRKDEDNEAVDMDLEDENDEDGESTFAGTSRLIGPAVHAPPDAHLPAPFPNAWKKPCVPMLPRKDGGEGAPRTSFVAPWPPPINSGDRPRMFSTPTRFFRMRPPLPQEPVGVMNPYGGVRMAPSVVDESAANRMPTVAPHITAAGVVSEGYAVVGQAGQPSMVRPPPLPPMHMMPVGEADPAHVTQPMMRMPLNIGPAGELMQSRPMDVRRQPGTPLPRPPRDMEMDPTAAKMARVPGDMSYMENAYKQPQQMMNAEGGPPAQPLMPMRMPGMHMDTAQPAPLMGMRGGPMMDSSTAKRFRGDGFGEVGESWTAPRVDTVPPDALFGERSIANKSGVMNFDRPPQVIREHEEMRQAQQQQQQSGGFYGGGSSPYGYQSMNMAPVPFAAGGPYRPSVPPPPPPPPPPAGGQPVLSANRFRGPTHEAWSSRPLKPGSSPMNEWPVQHVPDGPVAWKPPPPPPPPPPSGGEPLAPAPGAGPPPPAFNMNRPPPPYGQSDHRSAYQPAHYQQQQQGYGSNTGNGRAAYRGGAPRRGGMARRPYRGRGGGMMSGGTGGRPFRGP